MIGRPSGELALNFYAFYQKLVSGFRSHKLLVKMIFGFYPPEAKWGQYRDWTTLGLRSCLKKYCSRDTNLLDMGCGPYAILSRYAQIRLHIMDITAADHISELVAYARQHDPDDAITYVHSDLFGNISRQYGLIIFNAPYLEQPKGKKLGLIHDVMSERRFSGGNSGSDTIKRFLATAPQFLQRDGLLMLGVNLFHINKGLVEATIWKSGLKVLELHYNPLSKACIYILKENTDA